MPCALGGSPGWRPFTRRPPRHPPPHSLRGGRAGQQRNEVLGCSPRAGSACMPARPGAHIQVGTPCTRNPSPCHSRQAGQPHSTSPNGLTVVAVGALALLGRLLVLVLVNVLVLGLLLLLRQVRAGQDAVRRAGAGSRMDAGQTHQPGRVCASLVCRVWWSGALPVERLAAHMHMGLSEVQALVPKRGCPRWKVLGQASELEVGSAARVVPTARCSM